MQVVIWKLILEDGNEEIHCQIEHLGGEPKGRKVTKTVEEMAEFLRQYLVEKGVNDEFTSNAKTIIKS